ncbi:NUDIX hydrolase [Alginatibacterium sediminis]|uniref:GDP-mannose pyrophosphatase n=1 Tax=Alginatibacterium sediminis TaxID=2164068 RepID=A0A420EL97_9ALTE|nr:NUDIX hydrolase [Alginatibacterium sediminis]RKF21511.1 NUDIX hydrolase [Alginatibacterium sediminis]
MSKPHTVPFSWHKFEVRRAKLRLPNQQLQEHTFLHHPGAVVIVPLFDNLDLLCIRQYRAAIDQWIIELPAGTLEPNEAPELSAKRELIEECNYQAQTWQKLGELLPAPGFCDERQYIYMAQQLSPCLGQCDEDEFIEPLRLSFEEFEGKVFSGEIIDAKTIAAYFKARQFLLRKETNN